VLSDGEVQEGSTWEATMMASSLRLDNLVASSTTMISRPRPDLPDASQLLSGGRQVPRLRLGDVEVAGHDSQAIFEAATGRAGGKPLMVVARHKGKGVKLHGECADLALSLAGKTSTRQAVLDARGRRHEEHLLEALYEEATRNPEIYIVVADISRRSMAKFSTNIRAASFNVGVAEQSIDRHLRRLALKGCQPFAYTIATFSLYGRSRCARRSLLSEPAGHRRRHGCG